MILSKYSSVFQVFLFKLTDAHTAVEHLGIRTQIARSFEENIFGGGKGETIGHFSESKCCCFYCCFCYPSENFKGGGGTS